ncbi:MAG: flagellar hook-length control protein FliK [Methylococcaceae bacterium]
MNIDSSNVNTLLSGESLEGMQQYLSVDGAVSTEFSDTLMQKIKQLSGTDEANRLNESSFQKVTDNSKMLQEIAGLLNEKTTTTDFSSIFGKVLPINEIPGQGSDLDNTLSDLGNLIEQVKHIVAREEDQVTKIVEGLKEISVRIEESLSNSLDDNKTMIDEDNPVEEVFSHEGIRVNTLYIEENIQIKEDLFISDDLASHLDEVLGRIYEVIDLAPKTNDLNKVDALDSESQIELLKNKIANIEDIANLAIATRLSEKKSVEVLDSSQENNNLQAEDSIATVFSLMNESLKTKNIVSESKVIGQVLQETKQEGLSLKQTVAEKTIGIVANVEADDLSHQENKFGKSRQDNPFISTKLNTNLENPVLKDVELNSEKPLPKFATELAMLNRAVIAENKTEIPPMTKHFSHPEWNKEMGERVIWMHKQEIPSAELRLNPKHLGPVTIKIDVTQDQATVAFTAQHAVVKEAIEASLPKLREMFSAQQLNLVDVNVSQNDSGQRQAGNSNQMGQEAGEDKNRDSNEMSNAEQVDKQMEIADEIEAGRAIASNGILSIFA